MADFEKSAVIFFFQMLLVLSLLLGVSMAENKLIEGSGIPGADDPALVCPTAYAVRAGDGCSFVAEMFGMTNRMFHSINPNVDRSSLYMGLWLCVQ